MTRAALPLVALLLGLLAACGDSPTKTEPTPEVGEKPVASVARGGLLYDKYWKVAKLKAPTETHPLWSKRPDMASNKRIGPDTWRCKECHGWDYRGVEGAYASGSHKTGFPGIVGSTLSQAEIVASLADAHGYRAAGLRDVDLESLAMFVREGLVDTTQYIDDKASFGGDAEKGAALYRKGLGGNKACQVCHGPDGTKVPKGSPPDYEDFVGKVAGKNPWEFLHKVRFGHPGSKMPAAVSGTATIQDIIDLSAHAQSLPKSK